MKTHLNLVSPKGIDPPRPRAVCGTHAPALVADYVSGVTCRRCLQSAARLIDDGLAEVSQTWKMHKDKTRTLVGEELVLLPANEKSPSVGANEK